MRTLIITIVLATLWAPNARADDPATRFPPDSLLYAELTDLTDLPQKLVDLPVWRDKQQMADAKKLLLKMLEKMLAKQFEIDWPTVTKIAGQARKLTFCLNKVHRRGTPELTLVLDLSDTTDAQNLISGPLAKMFKNKIAFGDKTAHATDPTRDGELLLHVGNQRVIFTMDRGSMQTWLQGPRGKGSLASLKAFQKMRERYGKRLLWAFCNVGSAINLMTDSMRRRMKMEFDQVDSVFNFRGIRYAGAGSSLETSIDGRATEATLIIDPEHRVYNLARTPTLDQSLLAWVPADSTAFVIGANAGNPVALWKEIVKLGKETDQILKDDDFSKVIEGFKVEAGMSLGQLLSHFNGSALMTAPMFDRALGNGPAFVATIKNRAEFDKLMATLKQSALFARMKDQIKHTTYRGATIEWYARTYSSAGYAVLGNTVILTGEHRCLKSYIDAYLDKKSLAQQPSVVNALAGYHKIMLFDPIWLASQEREFSLLGSLVKKGVPLGIGSIEEKGRLRLGSNISALSTIAGLGLSVFRWETMSSVANRCRQNLDKVGDSLIQYIENHGKYPAKLTDLKLPQGTLVCPLEKNRNIGQSYKYVPIIVKNLKRYYGMTSWCSHTDHGRVLLYTQGSRTTRSLRAGEASFKRHKRRMEQSLAEYRTQMGADQKANENSKKK